MATVRELLDPARRRLAAAGIDRPGREAALLLRSLLGMSEAALLAHDLDAVPPALATRFTEQVEARARRMPTAYLIGEREFYGRPFWVDARVLIPRPESEGLIEAALGLPLPSGARVLDLATGSGCLAVTLAAERAGWRIVGSDLAPGALAVARRNARRHAVADRVTWVATDLIGGLQCAGFDLLVVNPPYVDPATRDALAVDVREYEPAQALFAERRGLALFDRLFAALGLGVAPPYLLCEIGQGQLDEVVRIATANGRWSLHAKLPDLAGIDRHLVFRQQS